MIGLKQGEVALFDHQTEWEEIAAETIKKLKEIFGDKAVDIQHIGSTAIRNIKAKPIIDIAVGIYNFEALDEVAPNLEAYCVYKSAGQLFPGIVLYSKDDPESGARKFNIQAVMYGSSQWKNHINFRDYMNVFPKKAAQYESLKTNCAQRFPNDVISYSNGKNEFINTCIFEADIYFDMKQKLDIMVFKPITEGLSSDKKYYIETTGDGKRFLLRVSNISEYERKKTIFDIMKKTDDLGVPMCRPVDFGICNDGKNVYQLLTWCEGVNAESVLPFLPDTEQYVVGIKAGEILRTIHSIPAPHDLDNWLERYFSENGSRIKAFLNCGIQIDGSDILFKYAEYNKHLLNNRPQCLQHGDYHIGNLMITNNGNVSVIDWELLDFDNYADPWHEFSSIGLSDVRPYFTTGLIRGYFGGEPPIAFWQLLAFYLAAGALMLVSWAYYSQHDELAYATQHVKDVLSWYDNFNTIVPSWYIQDKEG